MTIVIKRDGREELYNPLKIKNALTKAFKAVDETSELSEQNNEIIDRILNAINGIKNDKVPVEEIQDIIENKLMQSSRKDVAKAYILYRNERNKARERNSKIILKAMERINSTVDVRSNANVDEKSFSGREKEMLSDISKTIALNYDEDELSEEVTNAHKEMLLYQHDLEKAIFGVHNCLFINFQELFENGFITRNGDVRHPSSFSTACQLMAVAMQCQSQVQFGGVGTVHQDFDLAPFVKMSFYKHFCKALKYIAHESAAVIDTVRSVCKQNNYSIDDPYFMQYGDEVYNYAISELDEEGSQAAEGLYHNLNTLESRQGGQVPFTSTNLGRDTTPEGRLVIKWMMNASIAGIGKHHQTSIFPISIFQYKHGTNAHEYDPNYDLKRLALLSMSKRIYPNWCNCDWSQAHEDENDPDTFMATMGK